MIGKALAIQAVIRRATPHTIIRRAQEEGEYNDEGEFVKYDPPSIIINLYAVPATRKRLEALPEGMSTREAKEFWTVSELTLEDRVIIGNSYYTVMESELWESGFYNGILIRTGEVDTNVA